MKGSAASSAKRGRTRAAAPPKTTRLVVAKQVSAAVRKEAGRGGAAKPPSRRKKAPAPSKEKRVTSKQTQTKAARAAKPTRPVAKAKLAEVKPIRPQAPKPPRREPAPAFVEPVVKEPLPKEGAVKVAGPVPAADQAVARAVETKPPAPAAEIVSPATRAEEPARPVAAPRPATGPMPPRPILQPRLPAKAEVFVEGDHVVYPTHGVGKVDRIATEEIAGHKLELIHITFEENRMTLRVPVAKARSAGLRKLATRKNFDEALAVLRGRARIKRTMWSRRAQEYEAKINSGDPMAIAEVVRDLHRNAGQPDQSFSERQIYEAAMDRLAAELAALDQTDKMTAAQKLSDFLKTIV